MNSGVGSRGIWSTFAFIYELRHRTADKASKRELGDSRVCVQCNDVLNDVSEISWWTGWLQMTGKIKAVFSGKPGEVIADIAAEEKCSMIVMGTRGLGTVRRTIMGSVSDYVVHHAHCPVIVCRN